MIPLLVSLLSLFPRLLGNKLLTRLRVGVSHLRAHKHAHNFQDIPNPNYACESSENETAEHYLLYCPNHMISRQHLFVTLRKYISLVSLTNAKYTCDLLLYGDPKYNWNINKEIMKATIEFILTTKRFDTPLIET